MSILFIIMMLFLGSVLIAVVDVLRDNEIKEKQEEESEAARKAQELAKKLESKKTKTKKLVYKLITNRKYLYIETSIWVDRSYNPLFSFLNTHLSKDQKLILPKSQFEEITSIKYQNVGAYLALERIEKLQKRNLLVIQEQELSPMQNVAEYSPLVRVIMSHLQREQKVSFITNDTELRIRLRSDAQEFEQALNIYQGQPILKDCKLLLKKS